MYVNSIMRISTIYIYCHKFHIQIEEKIKFKLFSLEKSNLDKIPSSFYCYDNDISQFSIGQLDK